MFHLVYFHLRQQSSLHGVAIIDLPFVEKKQHHQRFSLWIQGELTIKGQVLHSKVRSRLVFMYISSENISPW